MLAAMADPESYRPATGTIPTQPGVYRFSAAAQAASTKYITSDVGFEPESPEGGPPKPPPKKKYRRAL